MPVYPVLMHVQAAVHHQPWQSAAARAVHRNTAMSSVSNTAMSSVSTSSTSNSILQHQKHQRKQALLRLRLSPYLLLHAQMLLQPMNLAA